MVKNVPGHSVASKRTTLTDVSERRFTPERVKNDTKKFCCMRELCTHEFWTHGKIDVPWWACYNEQCAEHYAMKAKNGIKPKLPITITVHVYEKDAFVDLISDTSYIGN